MRTLQQNLSFLRKEDKLKTYQERKKGKIFGKKNRNKHTKKNENDKEKKK